MLTCSAHSHYEYKNLMLGIFSTTDCKCNITCAIHVYISEVCSTVCIKWLATIQREIVSVYSFNAQ